MNSKSTDQLFVQGWSVPSLFRIFEMSRIVGLGRCTDLLDPSLFMLVVTDSFLMNFLMKWVLHSYR